MQKLTSLLSRAVPLPAENMDTDRIIPARFLKATTRSGMGDKLFCDLRFDASGKERPEFVLNNKTFAGAILLAGTNFGCGSSREHAAWALSDYGFRVIVSERFADIFRNNALNNGLLPIELRVEEMHQVFALCLHQPETTFLVDLDKQNFSSSDNSFKAHFNIPSWKKQCLLQGLDDIDYLLSLENEIKAHESNNMYQQLLNEIKW